MKNRPSLPHYIKKRNGVPLGASGSLSNMLKNSFGAGSLSEFWVYWNPIWSYYLRYFIFLPLRNYLPNHAARVTTFLISGALHDVAVGLISGQWQILCSLWFLLMGTIVSICDHFRFKFATKSLLTKALINLMHVIVPLILSINLQRLI